MSPKRPKRTLSAAPAYRRRNKSARKKGNSEASSYDFEKYMLKKEFKNVDPLFEESCGSNSPEHDATMNQNNDEIMSDSIKNPNNDEPGNTATSNKQLSETLDEVIQRTLPLKYLTQAKLDDCVRDIKESKSAIIVGKVISPRKLQAIANKNKQNLISMFSEIMYHLLHRPMYKYDYELMGKIHRVILTFPFNAWCTPTNESTVEESSGSSDEYHLIEPVIVGGFNESLSHWLEEADAYIIDIMTRRFIIEPDSYYDFYYTQTIRKHIELDLSSQKDRVDAIKSHYVDSVNFLFAQACTPLSSDYSSFVKLSPDFVNSKPVSIYKPSADEVHELFENHLVKEKISFEPDSKDLRCRERHLIHRGLINNSASVSEKMEAYESEVKGVFKQKIIYRWQRKSEAIFRECDPITVFSKVEPNLASRICMAGTTRQIEKNDISRSMFLELFTYSLESTQTCCILEDYFVTLVLNIEWDSHKFKRLRREYADKEKKLSYLKGKIADLKGNNEADTSKKEYEEEFRNLEPTMLAKPVVYSMKRVDEGKSRYTSVAVLFALMYHGLTTSYHETVQQAKVILEMDLYLRKSATLSQDELEQRLAVGLTLDAHSSRSNTLANVDLLTDGGPRDAICCHCQKWTGFEVLQDETHNSQVYLFDFGTICTYIPDLETDIKTKNLQKPLKVVMKVYDVMSIAAQFDDYNYEGIDMFGLTFEEFKKVWDDRYYDEVECYRRIIEYNNSPGIVDVKINIPEIYRCGTIRVYSKEKGYEFDGRFILMEYIDSKPETLSDDALEKGSRALWRLGDLGISHNDITSRNVLVKDGQMVLIDFSRASLSNEPPVDNYEDDRDLKKVWKELRSKGTRMKPKNKV